jgi:succinate dehydrogenase / fumarate reductase membrane anchor subunit
MSLKSPVGRALGLGSAGSGTGHWWAQRLTAVAMIPLTLWFAVSLLLLETIDYYAVVAWLSDPLSAVLLVLLVLVLVYHSSLGTQVVVEDYVHEPAARVIALGVLWLLHVALAVAGVFAVIDVAIGVAA